MSTQPRSAADAEFAEFARARWRRLVRAGVLLGCSPPEAEDLAQATLLRCYTGWRQVERAENRDAYVHRVLVNGFRASRRRRWWGERPTDELPEPREATPDASTDVAVSDAVERALGSLPRGQREAVVLRYWSHLGEQQIADALGIAPGTVKSRLSRALAHLAADGHLADFAPRRTP